VQTGLGAYAAAYTLGTGSVITQGKVAEVKDRVEINPPVPSRQV
jgi:hypothetical protein